MILSQYVYWSQHVEVEKKLTSTIFSELDQLVYRLCWTIDSESMETHHHLLWTSGFPMVRTEVVERRSKLSTLRWAAIEANPASLLSVSVVMSQAWKSRAGNQMEITLNIIEGSETVICYFFGGTIWTAILRLRKSLPLNCPRARLASLLDAKLAKQKPLPRLMETFLT